MIIGWNPSVDISVLAQDPPTSPPLASNRDIPQRPSDIKIDKEYKLDVSFY